MRNDCSFQVCEIIRDWYYLLDSWQSYARVEYRSENVSPDYHKTRGRDGTSATYSPDIAIAKADPAAKGTRAPQSRARAAPSKQCHLWGTCIGKETPRRGY